MLALVGCAALVLGACAQSNTPTEYNELTNQNFLETCTNLYYENVDGTIVPDEPTGDTVVADATGASPAQCQCSYNVFVNNMSIEDFTKLNDDLKDDANAWNNVPQNIRNAIDDCGTDPESATTTSTEPSSDTTGG